MYLNILYQIRKNENHKEYIYLYFMVQLNVKLYTYRKICHLVSILQQVNIKNLHFYTSKIEDHAGIEVGVYC